MPSPQLQILQALVDALNAETRINSISPQRMANIIQRILDLFQDLEPDCYLRKDRDDATPYKLTTEGGLQIGESFVPGLTGTGGLIDSGANGELESLILRRWLEVPEIRYNNDSVKITEVVEN